MTLQKSILFGFFHRLRQAGFPLGMDDYFLALKAVEGGFGLNDEATLYRLCCALWLKSNDEENHFRRIFEQHLSRMHAFMPELDQTPEPEEAITTDSDKKDEPILEKPEAEAPNLVGSEETVDLALDFEEAVQVAQMPLTKPAQTQSATHFMLKPTNLPVTLRQMKRTWRYLRRFSRTGPAVELDVEATIQQVSRDGFFHKPVLRPRRTNQARLVLMLDQGGSMAPFHLFSQQLIHSARRGGRLQETDVYYFHNVPLRHLYNDPARLEEIALQQVIGQVGENTAVLIFSDAGAARRYYNIDRILQTEQFVEAVKQQVRYCVWLNPVPNERWRDTSAAEIARLIPMFELSRPDLDAAINALRGQGHYWEKTYQWMI